MTNSHVVGDVNLSFCFPTENLLLRSLADGLSPPSHGEEVSNIFQSGSQNGTQKLPNRSRTVSEIVMPTLSEYTNVYNTALLLLQKKGFQVWYDKESEMFCAESEGWDFMAESPCGLLGLVSIYEEKGPDGYSEYWWKTEGKDVYKKIPTNPEPYISVVKK